MAVAAALDLAAGLDERHVVVAVSPDSATNYLSELTR
jgi:cysteine synthase